MVSPLDWTDNGARFGKTAGMRDTGYTTTANAHDKQREEREHACQ
jgi:hypothetical protein